MTSYLLRFDDLCPTMNWDIWVEIEALLDMYDIRPIVAVVPANKDAELMIQEGRSLYFWERVRSWQEKNWVIAIHGYTHIYDSDDPGLMRLNAFSEFAGHPYQVQRERMLAGLSVFRSNRVNPVMWVAPAHSFDVVTLEVLNDLNIKMISDGFSFRATKDSRDICWIPQQLWNFKRMPFGLWTFCCHPNSMGIEDLNNLAEFLKINHHDFPRDIVSIAQSAPVFSAKDKLASFLVSSTHRSQAMLCKMILWYRKHI